MLLINLKDRNPAGFIWHFLRSFLRCGGVTWVNVFMVTRISKNVLDPKLSDHEDLFFCLFLWSFCEEDHDRVKFILKKRHKNASVLLFFENLSDFRKVSIWVTSQLYNYITNFLLICPHLCFQQESMPKKFNWAQI